MNLILIGYRGSGKSTLARLLSAKIGGICLDTDLLIEKETGQSVATLFRTKGERAFRDIEAAVIQSLPALITPGPPGQNAVIATGGGSVLLEANRRVLRALGTVVWLTASPETLAGRLTAFHGSGSAERPRLAGTTVRDEIDTLLPVREPYYAEIAHHTIDTSRLTPNEVLQHFSRVFPKTSEK